MELVKLKMKMIYKSFLAIVGLLLILIISIGVLYVVNDHNSLTSADILVTGDLSVNYVDGKVFNNIEKNSIKFSITNNSEHVNYYTICFNKVRGNGKYKLLYKNNVIIEGELRSIDEIKTDYLSIDAYETKEYQLDIISEEKIRGTIIVRNEEEKNETFANLILKNTPPVNSAKTKVGSEIANTDEGLIKSVDDIGISYYYRGDIKNNYVNFGGLSWRIVRINGDGTVRIVLDGETSTIASYYSSTNNSFEFENSNIKSVLNNWLNENLSDYKDYISLNKYCSDIDYDDNKVYYAYTRILTNKLPILSCLGTTIRSEIGLLTIDEVILAGANTKDINQNFYLYNANISNEWYTMSAYKGSDNSINMFMINVNGSINTNVTGNLYRSVRPVINLGKNIQMTGSGTVDEPYELIEKES